MSELTDALNSVNKMYSSVNGITVITTTENMKVGDYLPLIISLHKQALSLLDQAIASTQSIAQYTNVSAQLSQLQNSRTQLVDLYHSISVFFDGVLPSLTLNQAWDQHNTSPPVANPQPYTPTPDDTVVPFGDTPMLLRASDPSVPIGAAFSGPPSGLIVSSPEISIASDQSWHIGTVTGAGIDKLVPIIREGAIGGLKGMLGEFIANNEYTSADYTLQAKEAYDLGSMINDKANKSIDLIGSGLEVLNGNKSLFEWEAEHNAFLAETQNDFNTLATSTIVSKIPVVGWILSPVVDAYMKMSYQLKNTNSFVVSVTADSTITGGTKGGVFLGGSQDDHIVVGNGNALAAGGAGNDRFTPGTGKQILLGDSGIDTVVYTNTHTEHTLIKTDLGYTVSDPQDTQTLVDVERLKFSDTNIALDINGNTGTVAKILGIVFSSASLTNKEYVGIGLHYLDNGLSYSDLMLLALNTKLGTGFANADEINLLYDNLVGALPSADELNNWQGAIASGQYTQASLAIMAANTSLNADNIHLLGLAQTGLEFIG